MAGRIHGKQIKDDSLTGDDIDESTLIFTGSLIADGDGDTRIETDINSADEDKILFTTSGNVIGMIDNLGKFGLGTGNPQGPLHLQVGNGPADLVLSTDKNNINAGDGLGNVSFKGTLDSDSSFKLGAMIHVEAAQNWNGGSNTFPTKMEFKTSETNSPQTRMTIDESGRVGVNTGTPNETLTVDGVVSLKEQASTPGNASNFGKLYVKQSDSALYFKNDSGTEHNLLSTDGVWQGDGTYVYPVDSGDSVVIGDTASVTGPELTLVRTVNANSSITIGQLHQLVWNKQATGDCGIGFYTNGSISSNSSTPGAAIVHSDGSSFSYGSLEFRTKNEPTDTGDCKTRLVIKPKGQVGIGYRADTRSSLVSGVADSDVGSLSIHSHNDTADSGPEINLSRYDANMENGHNFGEINFWGSTDNSTYRNNAKIVAESAGTQTDTNIPTIMKFEIGYHGSGNRSVPLYIDGTHSDTRVGIGTTNPTSKLHVSANKSQEYVARFFNDGNNADRYGLRISCGKDAPSSNGDIRWIGLIDGNGGTVSQIQYRDGGDGAQFATLSDERVKTEIQDSQVDATNIFKNLPVRQFKKIRSGITGSLDPVGFIAQEVEQVIPSMISESSVEGYDTPLKSLGHSSFIPYLVKAVKELIEKNEQLEARIRALEG